MFGVGWWRMPSLHTFFGHVTLHTIVCCFIFIFSYPLRCCASSPWRICKHACRFWHLSQPSTLVTESLQCTQMLAPSAPFLPPTRELFRPGAARPCPTWSSGWVHLGGWLIFAKCWCGRSVKGWEPGDTVPGIARWPADRPGCARPNQPTGRCKVQRGSHTAAWDTRSPSGLPER